MSQVALPPSASDLHWLLVAIGLVMALILPYLSPWIAVFIALFFGWRYLIERNAWHLPSLWILLPITVLGGIGVLITYRGFIGRDASISLLVIMLALKLMETRSKRDFTLVVYIGYFTAITAFLFDQTMLIGAFLLLPLIALTITLIGVNHPNGGLDWRFKLKLARNLLLQSIPFMLLLFLLFPRIPGPLWGIPKDAYEGMTGLSDSMEPGNISQLSQSHKTAFRVEFKGKVPPNNALYWRGPVLWHFDGRKWSMSSPDLPIGQESLELLGEPVPYTVTLEPHNRNWLLMLEMPAAMPPDALRTRDMQALSKRPVRTRIRYDGAAHFNYKLGESLPDRARELTLQIHDGENARTVALAQRWLAEGKSPQEIVEAALGMFRNEQFFYTLTPPLLGANPIDDFLFNTRRGFCEHYASSFAYLMRAAGIPARVVTGYQGGELNPVGNYLIVRQSDAHAWAEVWLEGKGWLRVDPTAAVAPQRVNAGIEAALPNDNLGPVFARRDYPLLRKLYLNWDAVNNGWNQWVLGYNQEKQMELLNRLTGSDLSWQDLVLGMVVSLATIGLFISYFLLRGKKRLLDPVQRLYLQFLRKLERAGLTRYAHEGPLDFSLRATRRLPARAAEIEAITKAYTGMRYRSNISAEALAAFRRMIQAFKSP